jgi:hypothetical protein
MAKADLTDGKQDGFFSATGFVSRFPLAAGFTFDPLAFRILKSLERAKASPHYCPSF